jgi:hypothetical protein
VSPEILLLVEYRQAAGGISGWYHGFARMGAGHFVAKLGDRTVWEQAAIKPWNSRERYFSTYGPVDSVFGSER